MDSDNRIQAAIDAGHPEWADLPSTGVEARAADVTTRFFTGRECKRGHVSPRHRTGYCFACDRALQREYFAQPENKQRKREYCALPKNKERIRETARKEHRLERARKYNSQPENKQRRREYDREYRALPKNKERAREHAQAWRDANPDKARAFNAHRRALMLNATPPWADRAAILAIYTEAQRLTETTGLIHHVDHIIPLNHSDVCGLHIAANLQILTASDNLSKGNAFDGTLSNDGWRVNIE